MNIKVLVLLLYIWVDLAGIVFSQPGEQAIFEKKSIKTTGVKFRNTLMETDNDNMLSFINFYSGCGVGIIDVNNDGLQDIFFAGNLVSSRLYLNKGGFVFQDITSASGVKTDRWITGVSIVDINQDGYDDIYLSVSGSPKAHNLENLLFVNNGDNTFSEKAADFNLNLKVQTTQTSFFDYDRDGDLDAFLATNPTDFELNSREALQKPKEKGESQGTDKLLRNEGNGKFTDVSKEAGILKEGYSLGLNTSDFNQDGWIDILVTNDYIGNDILYINNGDGTFTDQFDKFFSYSSFASMGNDAGDINNDGLIDFISLDMLPESSYRQKVIAGGRSYDSYMYTLELGYLPQFSRNMLQLNNGNNTFSDIGRLAGISRSDWSWAPLLVDLDNDGDKDLFITTGFRRDMGNMDFIYKTDDSPFKRSGEPVPISDQLEAIKRIEGVPTTNYVFRNNNDLTFTKVSKEWGFNDEGYSSGFAVADLDNDGDNDVIINKVNENSVVYENKTNNLNHHYLKIRLQGPDNNRAGLGSKIRVWHKGSLQYIDNNLYRGYMSCVEKNILFGTGDQQSVDSVEVLWLDGLRSVRYNVRTDTTITIQYKTASPNCPQRKVVLNKGMRFEEISLKLGIAYKHKEFPYVDFYKQPLLPHQNSQLGPCIAAGDINNDGLEDFFIGGARGYRGTFFFQKPDNTFHSSDFPLDQDYEDAGALLFDYDGDHDLDLYVVSGGTFAVKNSELYQDRLYRNTGNGGFEKTVNVLPAENSSGGVVTAADFDRDGDLDLFVGGRITPGNYPEAPASFLLENRNGRFIDVTDEKAPGLSRIGMVSSALWTDFTGDGFTDLILAGEWMPVTIFENAGGILRNRTKEYGLENTSGWWNSITSADFNNDGRMDYLLGNLGLNNPYSASLSEPLKLISKDFDNNGILDPLLIMKYADGYFPVASRSQFISAFPQKAKTYDRYETYARTNAESLLKDLGTEGATSLEAKYFANAIMFHNRDSVVVLKTLPNNAQFSPMFGSLADVFNDSRMPEILCVGNFFSANVTDGPYNSFCGGLISPDTMNNFNLCSGISNGFYVPTDARALASLVLGNQKSVYLVSSNNDSLKVFAPVNRKVDQIRLGSMDAYAIVEGDNFLRKQEFYYGSGYLSQSSRYLSLSPGWKKVKIVDYSGNGRIITSDDNRFVK